MADSDLEAIRQARMQELQSQSGGVQDSQKEEQKYVFFKMLRSRPNVHVETAKQKHAPRSFPKFSNPMQQIDSDEFGWSRHQELRMSRTG